MLVTAKLQHAHILPVLTAGAREGLIYYVTPFIRWNRGPNAPGIYAPDVARAAA